jgi:molybdopterin-guanine dinucleotide biosynthesis protein A
VTAFVILAAGKGSRIGRVGKSLHKALVPLGGKAVLSHIIDLAPYGSRIIIVIGHNGGQIKEYTRLAHPFTPIEFVTDDNPIGPGGSLLIARHVVGDEDMIFTSCDTLWRRDETMWTRTSSWAAVAPIPHNTKPERWCRVYANNSDIIEILDKKPVSGHEGFHGFEQYVYTGLAQVVREDLDDFWTGVASGESIDNEVQVSGGFIALSALGSPLKVMHIDWTDVGDATSYHNEVVRREGIDWSKERQATYVLPEIGRVIKWYADPLMTSISRDRCDILDSFVPSLIDTCEHNMNMLAYEYAPGVTAYKAIVMNEYWIVQQILDAWASIIWPIRIPNACATDDIVHTTRRFYFDKTMNRIATLPAELQRRAKHILMCVRWDDIARGVLSGPAHGDFNFGNIIIIPWERNDDVYNTPIGIDWRSDFEGNPWGDLRYDLAKLMAGCVVHWERVRHGNFTPWVEGRDYLEMIREFIRNCNELNLRDIEMIGVISLINCAPLHPEPLTTYLIDMAETWMKDLTS